MHSVRPRRSSSLRPFTSVLALLVALLWLLTSAPSSRAQGTESDVYVGLAIVAFEDKRYDRALEHLNQALAMEPGKTDALYYKGLVYLAQDRPVAAVDPLEQARANEPGNLAVLYQLGLAYFILGKDEEALPLLVRVLEENPGAENIGYYVGVLRFRMQDYDGALAAFRATTPADPETQELTAFYVGVTLAIQGLPEEAVAQLEEAQRARTAASPLLGPMERLRDTLASRRARERRLRAQLRFGVFYDTNVTVNPISSSDPDVIALRRRDANTPGELASANLQYSWLRSGAWESTVGYNFFQTINNDQTDFNLQDHLGSSSTYYRNLVGGMPFELGFHYTFDRLSLRDDRFLDRHSATAFATLVENRGNLTSVLGRYQRKDFDSQFLVNERDENRDADNWMVGVTHVFRFARDRHLIRIGYQYDQDDAEGQNWFYRGHRALVGGQYTLPWGEVRLQYNFDLHYRTYQHPNLLFPSSAPGTVTQEVYEQNHIVRVEKPLPYDFIVAADFQSTISRSDLDAIFNYNREVGTLSVIWVY